jgi:hypothetical protein
LNPCPLSSGHSPRSLLSNMQTATLLHFWVNNFLFESVFRLWDMAVEGKTDIETRRLPAPEPTRGRPKTSTGPHSLHLRHHRRSGRAFALTLPSTLRRATRLWSMAMNSCSSLSRFPRRHEHPYRHLYRHNRWQCQRQYLVRARHRWHYRGGGSGPHLTLQGGPRLR